MIVLTDSGDRLQVKLNAAVNANQLQCFATYRDHQFQPVVIINVYMPERKTSYTNNTTLSDIVLAPIEGKKRTVDFISIINVNSKIHNVSIIFKTLNDNILLWKGDLDVNERVQYTDLNGFLAYDSNGAVKQTTKTN